MKKKLKAFVVICFSLVLMYAMIPTAVYAVDFPTVTYSIGSWSASSGSLEVELPASGNEVHFKIYNGDGVNLDVMIGSLNSRTPDDVFEIKSLDFINGELGTRGETITVNWVTSGTTITFTKATPTPTPTPEPSKKKEKKEEKEEGLSYLEYLAMLAAKETDKEDAVEMKMRALNATVDKDTFKSEAPAKTIMSTDTMGADKFLDLKIHAADDTTKTNQNFLAQALVGTNVKILLTENVYSRRDLSIAENGSLQTLTWNNLPKNQPGPVYAVVYNQIDGAYEISGILDANGTATFTGFKLRPASTITICK